MKPHRFKCSSLAVLQNMPRLGCDGLSIGENMGTAAHRRHTDKGCCPSMAAPHQRQSQCCTEDSEHQGRRERTAPNAASAASSLKWPQTNSHLHARRTAQICTNGADIYYLACENSCSGATAVLTVRGLYTCPGSRAYGISSV